MLILLLRFPASRDAPHGLDNPAPRGKDMIVQVGGGTAVSRVYLNGVADRQARRESTGNDETAVFFGQQVIQ
jgi:hypothetical protein